MGWMTDPNIATQQQPWESPLTRQAKFAQLKSLALNNQEGQLRLADMQRQQKDQQDAEAAWAQSGGNQEKFLQSLSDPTAVLKYSTAFAAQKKAQADQQKTQLENAAKSLDLVGQHTQAILALPPEQRAAAVPQAIQHLAQVGAMSPQDAQQTLQSAPLNDPQALEQWLTQHGQQAITAKDQIAQHLQAQEQAEKQLQDQAVRQNMEATQQNAQLTQQRMADSQKETMRHNRAEEGLGFQRERREASKKDVDQQSIEIAAQSLANGDLTRLKDIASLRGDQRLLIFNRAKQLNPNFSTGEIDRKIKMEDAFTNGKDAQNIQSFGTFLEHAGEASQIVNKYRATNLPLINTPINKLRQKFGDAAYTQYAAALEPVRKEAENFLLNGHAQMAEDKKAANSILSDDATPAQQQAALKQLGHTVKARYTEANFRYKRTMGHDLQGAISPEALAGAKQIGVDMGAGSANSGPKVGAIEDGFRFKGGDPSSPSSWEKAQ